MRKSESDSKYFGESLGYLCFPCQNRQKPPKNMQIIYCVVSKGIGDVQIFRVLTGSRIKISQISIFIFFSRQSTDFQDFFFEIH